MQHRIDPEFVDRMNQTHDMCASTFNRASLTWAVSVLLRMKSPNLRFIDENADSTLLRLW
jgi:hypothetical protein